MPKGPSPLVGYNTNIRHKGKVYHIQTEDSGVTRPHIITHLFADGGRIVASRKTDYAQHVGSADLVNIVRNLMKEQHKAMFIALRDCAFDEEEAGEQPAKAEPKPVQDVEALDRAAEARAAAWAVGNQPMTNAEPQGGLGSQEYGSQSEEQAQESGSQALPRDSIFGGTASDQKSLDEVILSYLSDDIAEDEDI